MEFLQLRYFLKSAKTENFSVTAAEYRVPPSAVSMSVKKLETELGVKLFDRKANKIKLNQSGKRFAEAVSQALALIDDEIAKIEEAKNGVSGDIYLLVKSERSLITDKMTKFRKQYPAVSFHLVHSYSVTDYSQYDIVIDESSAQYAGFSSKPLITERIKIAAAQSNPIAGKRLRLTDLKGLPFITMSENGSLYRIIEQICREAGFRPNIVIESDDPYYIRKYIAEDFGIALFPETSWKHNMENICFLDIEGFDYTRSTYAYFNNAAAGNAAKLFFEHL